MHKMVICSDQFASASRQHVDDPYKECASHTPLVLNYTSEATRYRISLIISHTFLHETSHPKNGVRLTTEMRLTIEMRLTFRIFVKLTVRYAYAYAGYMKRHMQVSPDLVERNI